MPGERGKGDICINGAPARLFQPGDKIIILAEAWIEPGNIDTLDPVVVFVDDKNKVSRVKRHQRILPGTHRIASRQPRNSNNEQPRAESLSFSVVLQIRGQRS